MSYIHAGLRQLQQALIARPSLKHRVRPLFYWWNRVRFGSTMARNVELRDRFAGERCFLLFPGPSLNDVKFDALRNERVFAFSWVHKHPEFHKLKITGYMDLEPLQNLYRRNIPHDLWFEPQGLEITPRNAAAIIEDLYSSAVDLQPSVRRRLPLHFYAAVDRACPDPETIFILNAASRRYFERHGIFEGRRKFYVAKTAPPMEGAPVQSNDLARPTTFFDGVVFFAIAAALYMGFREIYLAGCGYTYQPNQEFYFFRQPKVSTEFPVDRASGIIESLARASGIVARDIRREGDWYVADFVQHIPVDRKHQIVKQFADGCGARVYNIVPSGFASPVYPALSWSEVERRLAPEVARPVTTVVTS